MIRVRSLVKAAMAGLKMRPGAKPVTSVKKPEPQASTKNPPEPQASIKKSEPQASIKKSESTPLAAQSEATTSSTARPLGMRVSAASRDPLLQLSIKDCLRLCPGLRSCQRSLSLRLSTPRRFRRPIICFWYLAPFPLLSHP